MQARSAIQRRHAKTGYPTPGGRPLTLISLLLSLIATGCRTPSQVSFRHHVYPILEEACVDCHTPPGGEGYRKTGLNMENYTTLMSGTIYGPVIVPGDSKHSILNMLVEGRADVSMRMPHNDDKCLSDEQIRILRLWVEQGARDN